MAVPVTAPFPMLWDSSRDRRRQRGTGCCAGHRHFGSCQAVSAAALSPQSGLGVGMRWVWLVWLGFTLCLGSGAAFAQENASFSAADEDNQSSHEGYYYPKPQSVEHFVSAVVTLPESNQ